MKNPRGYAKKVRNSFTRERRPVIVIAAEGKNKTEYQYFRDFGRDVERQIVFADGNYTDPVQMAGVLIKKCEQRDWQRENGDRAYCLIDSDTDDKKDIQIAKADRKLRAQGLQLLVSGPCFEIWYLCHYHANARQYHNVEEIISELRHFHPAYDKSTEGMYAATKERLQTAIQNAEKLRAACMDRGYQPHTVDFCPSTEIDVLAKELMRQER